MGAVDLIMVCSLMGNMIGVKYRGLNTTKFYAGIGAGEVFRQGGKMVGTQDTYLQIS